MENRTVMTRLWDKIGICASGLCLVHCLATPILLITMPASSVSGLDSPLTHQIFAIIVTISILLAVYPHCKKHGHKDIIAYAFVGFIFILAGILLHDAVSEEVTHGLTILGSIVLIYCHIKNMKIRHGKCHESSKKHCH